SPVASAASCSAVVEPVPQPRASLSPITVPRFWQSGPGTPFTGMTRWASGVGAAVAHPARLQHDASTSVVPRHPLAHRRRATAVSATRGQLVALEVHLVDVAPPPVLAPLQGLDDGVLGRLEVLGGVLVGARVTAADVATRQAQAEMNPSATRLQTLLAALGVRANRLEAVDVCALGHGGRRACSAREAGSIGR